MTPLSIIRIPANLVAAVLVWVVGLAALAQMVSRLGISPTSIAVAAVGAVPSSVGAWLLGRQRVELYPDAIVVVQGFGRHCFERDAILGFEFADSGVLGDVMVARTQDGVVRLWALTMGRHSRYHRRSNEALRVLNRWLSPRAG